MKRIMGIVIAVIIIITLTGCGGNEEIEERIRDLEREITRQEEKNTELEEKIRTQEEKSRELERKLIEQAGIKEELKKLKEEITKEQNESLELKRRIEEVYKELEDQRESIRILEDELELKHGIKPEDLEDEMPQIWEHEWDAWEINSEIDKYIIDVKGASTYTIGKEVRKLSHFINKQNLENIYVEEGNPIFKSVDGVLYSKSMETMYVWPPKKAVTQPRESIKYFGGWCYSLCDMPLGFELPDGTISIGRSAFYLTTNLREIHIKANVKTVGIMALTIAIDLKKIEISSPIVYGHYFDNGYNIETVIFKKGVRQIRAGYYDAPSYLEIVEFPDTLEAIGGVKFPSSMLVEKYTIPKSVRYIDDMAFRFYTDTTQFDCKSNYAKKRIEEIKNKI